VTSRSLAVAAVSRREPAELIPLIASLTGSGRGRVELVAAGRAGAGVLAIEVPGAAGAGGGQVRLVETGGEDGGAAGPPLTLVVTLSAGALELFELSPPTAEGTAASPHLRLTRAGALAAADLDRLGREATARVAAARDARREIRSPMVIAAPGERLADLAPVLAALLVDERGGRLHDAVLLGVPP
jgi:hypothetical protein